MTTLTKAQKTAKAKAKKAKIAEEKAKAVTPVVAVVKALATDSITMDYTDEGGTQLVKEVGRVVITSGAWATIMFQYQNHDKSTGKFGETKACIRRYQKKDGSYKVKSKFNVSSGDQAIAVAAVLTKWSPSLKQAVKKA